MSDTLFALALLASASTVFFAARAITGNFERGYGSRLTSKDEG